MKVKFTRDGVFLDDGRHDTGDIVGVSTEDANMLLQRQWVVPVDDVEPVKIDVEIENEKENDDEEKVNVANATSKSSRK